MKSFLWLLMLFPIGVWPQKAMAHGITVNYSIEPTIQLQAEYESGQPIADAQVLVYAPNNSQEPWLTGMANDQGQFEFRPDRAQPGPWTIQIQQAGRGDTLTIDLTGDSEVATVLVGNSGLTNVQKGVMGGAIVWGCVGTALFFRAKQLQPQPQPKTNPNQANPNQANPNQANPSQANEPQP
jgi:nickel transport protein